MPASFRSFWDERWRNNAHQYEQLKHDDEPAEKLLTSPTIHVSWLLHAGLEAAFGSRRLDPAKWYFERLVAIFEAYHSGWQLRAQSSEMSPSDYAETLMACEFGRAVLHRTLPQIVNLRPTCDSYLEYAMIRRHDKAWTVANDFLLSAVRCALASGCWDTAGNLLSRCRMRGQLQAEYKLWSDLCKAMSGSAPPRPEVLDPIRSFFDYVRDPYCGYGTMVSTNRGICSFEISCTLACVEQRLGRNVPMSEIVLRIAD